MTTYWISGYRDLLSVSDKHPNSEEPARYQICCLWMWPALGLPHEIAPGECWRVMWRTLPATCFGAARMEAIARNVTAELKEKSDG